MAHDPKLEVYKVILNANQGEGKSFRECLLSCFDEDEDISDLNLFKLYFQYFVTELDSEDFIRSERMKKALTAYDTNSDGGTGSTIKLSSANKLIYGRIDGGKYGRKRQKSALGGKEHKEEVNENDVILDQFFFYLYTPFESDTGILIIQSFSGDSITALFNQFIQEIFRVDRRYRKPAIDKFVPNSFIEEFKVGSNLKRFFFSTTIPIDELDNESVIRSKEEFRIRIEAESPTGLPLEKLGNWIRSIGGKTFSNKVLEDFTKKKAYLQNNETKKESPFDITKDLEIQPVIYLEGRGIDIDENGIPDHVQLKNYCDNLLNQEIIPEIYPDDVQES